MALVRCEFLRVPVPNFLVAIVPFQIFLPLLKFKVVMVAFQIVCLSLFNVTVVIVVSQDCAPANA